MTKRKHLTYLQGLRDASKLAYRWADQNKVDGKMTPLSDKLTEFGDVLADSALEGKDGWLARTPEEAI